MKTEKSGSGINLLLRVLLLVAGLFFLALGIALSTKSGLGVSPSAGVAYVLSEIFPLSMGTFTTLLNLLYILIQILILRKNFHPTRFLQLAVVFLFGYFTDFTLRLVSGLSVNAYPLQLLLSIFACAVMGFGVFLEVRANVIVMASEGALSVIAEKTGKEFGTVKILNDCLLIVVSVLLSLIAFRRIEGVREGTVIAAFLVGLFTQLCSRSIHVFDGIFYPDRETASAEPSVSDNRQLPLVITIEREWGSGGHEIGERLAKEMMLSFYDYQLIEKAAEHTGLPAEMVKQKEERVKGLIYTLYNQANAFTMDMSKEDAIFEAESKIIRDIASKESCVIVGRLGAYILKDRPNTFNIFLSAGDDFRCENLSKRSGTDKEEMLTMMHQEDKLRRGFCLHFTGKPWGLARHYDLSLDTSAYGLDNSLKLIRQALRDRVN